MKIEFDREHREIRINGNYAGYIDPSPSYTYESFKEYANETKIEINEVIKIDPPITRKDGSQLSEIKCPIMILIIKEEIKA